MSKLAIGILVALALAACSRKEAASTCGTSDTPPCAVGTGGAPSQVDGGPIQQK